MANSTHTAEKEIRIAEKITSFPRIKLTPAEKRVLRLYKGATETDWEDWRWQLKNRIKDKASLSRIIPLTKEEEKGIEGIGSKLTMSMSPYFASLIDGKNEGCPIRLQSVPRETELVTTPEELKDPCGEDSHSPVHGLVHRYPDRVLFLVNEMCSMYCRYCTRSRMVGDGKRTLNTESYQDALAYIRGNKVIRDVLISGGDPLLLNVDLLDYLIRSVKEIRHVEFVRIGTRVPVTLPQKVDQELVHMFKKHAPLWMSIHFNHPGEITERVKFACNSLADAGIPLGSQTVLLRGVNDNPQVMKKLMHELLKIRVRPYYIYQCDPIIGSSHFRTPLKVGLSIIEQLRGHTTGYANPTFVIDAPGGGGKIPISPDYVVSIEGNKYTLRNYEGKKFVHYDP